ncbi:hypothetical protein BaRGS_00012288 [Batillaria attramentaria]|uniref:Uncharacterized protein n=1 Tax=Batillaria attramentaria TaxID=370345 RepID=A0ABD0LAR1_9CAEN
MKLAKPAKNVGNAMRQQIFYIFSGVFASSIQAGQYVVWSSSGPVVQNQHTIGRRFLVWILTEPKRSLLRPIVFTDRRQTIIGTLQLLVWRPRSEKPKKFSVKGLGHSDLPWLPVIRAGEKILHLTLLALLQLVKTESVECRDLVTRARAGFT